MYKLDNRSRSCFLWNMIGSLSKAASSVVLLMVVTTINGTNDGGIYSIAYATAQLMFTIGSFDVRVYQSTDVEEKFKFQDYYTFRIITCTIMMILSIIYICFKGYSGKKAIIIFIMCFFYMIDALADVFEGLFQLNGRLDMSGKSLAIRFILSTIAFVSIIYFTSNLVIATISTCIVSIIWFYIYDVRLAKDYEKIKYYFDYIKIKDLFFECLPLFASSFMLVYIINAPKYAIDTYMEEMQNYFNLLFMPAAMINLFSIFLFKPLLTSLAKNFASKNIKKTIKFISLSMGWVTLLTVCAVIGAYLVGTPILSWIYSVDLSKYSYELIIIMIGGGASALSTVLYYVLTVMRKQFSILVGYSMTCIITLAITPIFVKRYGILGASMSYCIVMIILSLIFTSILIIYIRHLRKNK